MLSRTTGAGVLVAVADPPATTRAGRFPLEGLSEGHRYNSSARVKFGQRFPLF